MTDNKNVLTTKELAERWGCSSATVCNMIRRGQIPAIRLNHDYRILQSDILRYERGDNKCK